MEGQDGVGLLSRQSIELCIGVLVAKYLYVSGTLYIISIEVFLLVCEFVAAMATYKLEML